MKKILIILFFILVSVLIIYIIVKDTKERINFVEKRGVFISYLDNTTTLKGYSDIEKMNNIDKIIDNLDRNNINMIILHVRAFSDAIYDSDIFPYSNTVSASEGVSDSLDVLEYYIKKAHEKDIEVHAWINPYRIRSTSDISTISKINPAYKWLNTNNVQIDSEIYYNPASSEVLELVIDGVKEIILNYDIDGIHYDDYFYPNDTIDLENYQEYLNKGGTLNIKEYRYQNINKLLEETRSIIDKYNPSIKFGISPAGNIENTMNNEYLNIKYILSDTTYLDYVMPQIYFGFLNSNKPFIDTTNDWNDLIKNDKTKLYVALAAYKIGKIDNYAGEGKNEWVNSTNILAKQILYSRTLSNYEGIALFRYEYIFNENKYKNNSILEIANMLNLFTND